MLQVAGVSSAVPKLGAPDAVRNEDGELRALRRAGEPAALSHLMSQHLAHARPRSDAEALRLLRQAFPAAPLAARVAAMAERARSA